MRSLPTEKFLPGRFYMHQERLPHLPVPPLKQTLQKYLKTVRPLVNDKQFENTKALVDKFGETNGVGEYLNTKLQEYAITKENWLSKWWLNTTYLEPRTSVVINCSPSVSFPKYQFSGTKGQIEHAAKVIAAVVQYKVQIDNGTLPIDKMGKYEMCMDQYYRILSSCRTPGLGKDVSHCYALSWRPPSHITVIHNGHLFELCVYNDDASPLSISQLETQLSKIVANSRAAAAHPVGILTSRSRTNWTKAYQVLLKDRENYESLMSIERSIFAICLDEETPVVDEKKWKSDLSGRMMHGGGSGQNTGNRWFDKTIQIIVDKNGGVGLVYEHSPAEGPPIANMMDYVYKFCENPSSQSRLSSVLSLPPPKFLKFNISEGILIDIEKGKNEIDDLIAHLKLTVFNFDLFGKNLIKSLKLSPDAFIQLALQLAYYRRHKMTPATYESASLRRFRLGRTDTIRSSSISSHAFAEAMTERKISPQKSAQLLRNATTVHKEYTQDAISGQGIDRHLLGLRLIAKSSGLEIPLIFQDDTYKRAMSFNLSTSQVPCQADLSMAFGPAVHNGYGICYNPKNSHILISISSFDLIPGYDAEAFKEDIYTALIDMKDILISSSSKL